MYGRGNCSSLEQRSHVLIVSMRLNDNNSIANLPKLYSQNLIPSTHLRLFVLFVFKAGFVHITYQQHQPVCRFRGSFCLHRSEARPHMAPYSI